MTATRDEIRSALLLRAAAEGSARSRRHASAADALSVVADLALGLVPAVAIGTTEAATGAGTTPPADATAARGSDNAALLSLRAKLLAAVAEGSAGAARLSLAESIAAGAHVRVLAELPLSSSLSARSERPRGRVWDGYSMGGRVLCPLSRPPADDAEAIAVESQGAFVTFATAAPAEPWCLPTVVQSVVAPLPPWQPSRGPESGSDATAAAGSSGDDAAGPGSGTDGLEGDLRRLGERLSDALRRSASTAGVVPALHSAWQQALIALLERHLAVLPAEPANRACAESLWDRTVLTAALLDALPDGATPESKPTFLLCGRQEVRHDAGPVSAEATLRDEHRLATAAGAGPLSRVLRTGTLTAWLVPDTAAVRAAWDGATSSSATTGVIGTDGTPAGAVTACVSVGPDEFVPFGRARRKLADALAAAGTARLASVWSADGAWVVPAHEQAGKAVVAPSSTTSGAAAFDWVVGAAGGATMAGSLTGVGMALPELPGLQPDAAEGLPSLDVGGGTVPAPAGGFDGTSDVLALERIVPVGLSATDAAASEQSTLGTTARTAGDAPVIVTPPAVSLPSGWAVAGVAAGFDECDLDRPDDPPGVHAATGRRLDAVWRRRLPETVAARGMHVLAADRYRIVVAAPVGQALDLPGLVEAELIRFSGGRAGLVLAAGIALPRVNERDAESPDARRARAEGYLATALGVAGELAAAAPATGSGESADGQSAGKRRRKVRDKSAGRDGGNAGVGAGGASCVDGELMAWTEWQDLLRLAEDLLAGPIRERRVRPTVLGDLIRSGQGRIPKGKRLPSGLPTALAAATGEAGLSAALQRHVGKLGRRRELLARLARVTLGGPFAPA